MSGHANDYFADTTRESWSNALKYMSDSARAYRWHKDNPMKPKPMWAVYRSAHMGLLEPDRFDTDVVTYNGRRDKRTKAYKEFLEEHDGAEILSPTEYDTVRYMVDAGMNHKRAWELLSAPGASEKPVHWTDPVTGIDCKGLLDKHAWGRIVVDVKCSTPGDFHSFEHHAEGESWRPIRKYKYYGQVGFYEIQTGADGPIPAGHEDESQIVALESAPPYDVAVHEMGQWSKLGQELVRDCLVALDTCEKAGEWAGKYVEPVKSVPPPFMYKEEEDDLDYEE